MEQDNSKVAWGKALKPIFALLLVIVLWQVLVLEMLKNGIISTLIAVVLVSAVSVVIFGIVFWVVKSLLNQFLTIAQGKTEDEQEQTKIGEKAKKLMEQVGISADRYGRYPHEFSGGQRQRIGIARVLVMQPELIIADEPISALDVSIRAQVLNLLADLQAEYGLTYLFIAHDLSVMRYITNRLAVIHKGRLVELAKTEQLFEHPLHPYTKALLSAIPQPDPLVERERTVLTYDPSCHHYENDAPEWIELEKNHFVLANDEEAAQYRKEVKAK